uniref:DUF7673 family protein n=1 Tax=Acetobacter conturbans TaxID=1737472 RepID=UPI0018E9A18F|nr:hypothetical protein [Acetobacter conturbans]
MVEIAKGDTHQSGLVSGFLLAWWNAEECGGYDLTWAWALDPEIADDIIAVFSYVTRLRKHPDQITPELNAHFRSIIRVWRPELAR